MQFLRIENKKKNWTDPKKFSKKIIFKKRCLKKHQTSLRLFFQYIINCPTFVKMTEKIVTEKKDWFVQKKFVFKLLLLGRVKERFV